MELAPGQVAVVTGAGSGIGLALAERFAQAGLDIVLADVDEAALAAAEASIGRHGVQTLALATDVTQEASVQALASTAVSRFGAVHIVCNNAGVASTGDAWFGPLSTWQWVLGVNLWGVIHGVRAFLPVLIAQGSGHIVNTASIAGLLPGFSPPYDASKHAVVAITEDLYATLTGLGLPIGVSVLCPGWVRTKIMDADRNWPAALGDPPPAGVGSELMERHVRRAIDEGTTPAAVADLVVDAVSTGRFWIFPHPDFVSVAVDRWESIAEGLNPTVIRDVPGLPPAEELAAEMAAAVEALGGPPA